MRQGILDQMIEFAVAELASGDLVRVNRLVCRLAQKWPSEPALAICFAMTSAASILEEQFQNQERFSHRAYVLTSLVAADLYALEAMGQVPATGQHLLLFWRSTDTFFLDF